MHNENDNLVSLRDFVRVAFRHKFKAAAIFALTLGTITAVAFVLPKVYASEAKLFIRLGRTGVALDPTATVGQTISMSDTRERELNSAIEILKSRELLNDVIRELGAKTIVKQRASYFGWDMLAISSTETISHKAIKKLEKSISRDVAHNSSVITISCIARTPELAQKILQTYVQAFKMHHTRLHRTSGSFEFFETQTTELAQRLATAEAELRDAKNKVGVGSIEGEKKLIEGRLTELQKDLINTRTLLASANAKITALRERHPDIDLSSIEGTTDSTSQELTAMRTELFKLELRERELLTKLAPSHPQVDEIKDQVVQARQLFEKQQLIGAKAVSLSLEVKLAELDRQSQETKQMLLALNESAIHITALTQKTTTLRASFEEYQGKREQARVDSAMANKQISDVNIAQAATFNPKHVSPKKAIILVLGAFAAIFGAFGATMAAEYFDSSFQVAEQIESSLQLPVILSVPNSPTAALSV